MQKKFVQASWALLILNCLVILWGVFVRASGSGDGCGQHWPLCHGALVPQTDNIATWIEYAHRITSGMSLLGAAGLFIWARRIFLPHQAPRIAARFVCILTVIEALIGAMLVLLALTNQNASILRVLVVGGHLINTFFLLGACTLCAWTASRPMSRVPQIKEFIAHPLTLGLGGLMITAAFGAMAAVGDFLHPAESLTEGLLQDFSPDAPLFVRLRILHPIIAVITAGYIFFKSLDITRQALSATSKLLAQALIALLVFQITLGLSTVALLAPIALQMAHLFFADVIWVVCVLLIWDELQNQ